MIFSDKESYSIGYVKEDLAGLANENITQALRRSPLKNSYDKNAELVYEIRFWPSDQNVRFDDDLLMRE